MRPTSTVTNRRVADAYKRLLLLGCTRPNQLRQNELAQVHELFELWSEHVLAGRKG